MLFVFESSDRHVDESCTTLQRVFLEHFRDTFDKCSEHFAISQSSVNRCYVESLIAVRRENILIDSALGSKRFH